MSTIFTCSLYILFFLFVFGKLASQHLIPQKESNAMQGVGSYFLLFGVIYIHALIVQTDMGAWKFWAGVLFYLGVLLVPEVLYGLTLRKEQPSFFKRLQGFRLLMPDPAMMSERAAILVEQTYKLAGVTFIIWYLASGMGEYAATKTTTFFVSTSDPSLILVNVKDDKAICTRYDPKTLKVLHQLVVVPFKDNEQSSFQKTNVGVLSFDN